MRRPCRKDQRTPVPAGGAALHPAPHPRRVPARALLAVVLALGSGCGGEPQTPEARVRAALAALETAAEAGDVQAFGEHVSERYADEAGQDRRALLGLVTFHVMRHRGRHVFVRIRSLEIRESGRAEVTLAAALAGSTLAGEADVARLRADVWKIDLDLEEEDGDWRVVWAQWRPTAPADLL